MKDEHFQKEKFLAEEADGWFRRNALAPKTGRSELASLAPFIKPGSKVLEIGCSSGRNVEFFSSLGTGYFGIDPSAMAIEEAKKTYPQCRFFQGTADALPFSPAEFDVVFFGFCLYVVDRGLLSKAVAEADRVLRSPGFLAILDFETVYPCWRDYAHVPGMKTFKMDYSKLFLAFPHYVAAFKQIYSHSTDEKTAFEPEMHERISLQVIYKDLASGYAHTP